MSTDPNQNHLSWSIILAGHFLFPSFSIYLCLFVSQAAGSPLRFTVKPLMNSPLKFKQQHHLWIANCALMGEPVQTLCDQSSHRHQFTAKQVEVYYLERIFWNLKNTKKEVFIQQITLVDPPQQQLDMTYGSTAANFEQWKKHQLAPLYVLRTLISLNLWWLLTIVGLKIKARIQLKQ